MISEGSCDTEDWSNIAEIAVQKFEIICEDSLKQMWT